MHSAMMISSSGNPCLTLKSIFFYNLLGLTTFSPVSNVLGVITGVPGLESGVSHAGAVAVL